jgi:hypothetical protein
MAEKLVATITVRDGGDPTQHQMPQSANMNLDCGVDALGNYLDVSDVLRDIVETYSVGFWTRRSDNMSHEQQVPSDHAWPVVATEPYLKADQKAVMTFAFQPSTVGVGGKARQVTMQLPCPKKSMFVDSSEGLRVTKVAGDAIAAKLEAELDGVISGMKVAFVGGYLKSKK